MNLRTEPSSWSAGIVVEAAAEKRGTSERASNALQFRVLKAAPMREFIYVLQYFNIGSETLGLIYSIMGFPHTGPNHPLSPDHQLSPNHPLSPVLQRYILSFFLILIFFLLNISYYLKILCNSQLINP